MAHTQLPGSMLPVEVVSVKATRFPLTADSVPALYELYRLKQLPLATAEVSMELKGVPTAVVNALRRVLIDEMPGYALKVPDDGFNTELTSERFMLPQFVNARIASLRLRPQISADNIATLRLKLDVTNRGATVLEVYASALEVTAGTMPEPLYNPTAILAELQPGKRLVIEGVHITKGYGRNNGLYNVACRGAYTHLDLAQHDDAEVREEKGVAVDKSGYKLSSLVANPRHHLLKVVLPATTANYHAEARAIFADACTNIKDRLRLIATAVERRLETGGSASGVQYAVLVKAGLSEGVLQIPGETSTIGELLCRTIFELTPEVSNVAYTRVAHENRLSLTVRHKTDTENVTGIIISAIRHAIATFDTIQHGITAAR